MVEEPSRTTVPLVLAAAAAWSWRILVVVTAAAVVFLALVRLYVVVVPVVLALFVAAAVEPFVSRLTGRRWPRPLAAVTTFVGLLAVLSVAFGWIGTQVAGEFRDVGDQLETAVADIKEWLQGEPFNLSAQRIDELEADIRSAARGATGGLSRRAVSGARTATEVLGGLVLMLFTLFFVLKDGARMGDWFASRVPVGQRDDAVVLVRRSRAVMRQYLIATALTGLINGVLIAIALILLGVPLVLPLAVLTFLGGFVPIVGATVAGLVAALVAFVDGGLVTGLLVVAATIAIQQIEGNLLQPFILERAVRLHPLVTVWAVAAGLVIGGLLGAFLSVPLVAIGAGVVSHIRTRTGSVADDVAWNRTRAGTRTRGQEGEAAAEEAEGAEGPAEAEAAAADPED
jgi:predicted PurR-regulated permease PerM